MAVVFTLYFILVLMHNKLQTFMYRMVGNFRGVQSRNFPTHEN